MLTVGTQGSYKFRYGTRSETIGAVVYRRCTAVAQLMNLASSPGGTWPVFIAERRLSVLATALAAGFPRRGARGARLRGLARAAPAAGVANKRRQGDFRSQSGRESCSTGILGRAMAALLVGDSLSIVVNVPKDLAMKRLTKIWLLTLLLLALGTPALAQVSKVTADAKGIT